MKSRLSRGFALPTVMIASVVMLMVMVSAVSSTVAVRVSLDTQYYNQLSKTAGDAGVAYAKACLAQNGGVAKWSDAKPLLPNTDCSGDQLAGFTCTTANQLTESRCSVIAADSNTIASFSVAAPTVDSGGKAVSTNSVGNVKKVRSADSAVWRQYSASVKSTKFEQVSVNLASIKQISSSQFNSCVVASDDNAYCWGHGTAGQLGNGLFIDYSAPVAVVNSGLLSGKTIKSVAAGTSHACAIASDDKVYCWGDNYYGQLGNGSNTQSSTPVAVNTSGVLSGKTIKSISAGGSFTCAVDSDGKVYCWGDGQFGQLGNNSSAQSNVPVAVYSSGVLSGKTIKSIVSGSMHSCVIANDDKAYCWGHDGYGQVGDGNISIMIYVPAAVMTSGVLSGKTIKSISTGTSHTCAVANDDKAYCWGWNSSGQIGIGGASTYSLPAAVDTSGVLNGKTITSVSAGHDHSCASNSEGKVYCWGLNAKGQLGDGTITQRLTPALVSASGELSGKSIKSVTSGYEYACSVSTEGQLYCWGSSQYGQLGNGSFSNSNVPAKTYTSIFDISKILSTKILYYSY